MGFFFFAWDVDFLEVGNFLESFSLLVVFSFRWNFSFESRYRFVEVLFVKYNVRVKGI